MVIDHEMMAFILLYVMDNIGDIILTILGCGLILGIGVVLINLMHAGAAKLFNVRADDQNFKELANAKTLEIVINSGIRILVI